MTDERHEKARKEINDLMQGLNNGQIQVNYQQSNSNTKQENSMRCLYFCQFVWIVVFAIILSGDGECEQPIRLWIKVLMYCFIVNVVIAIAGCTTSLPSNIIFVQAFIHLFEVIWYIIGTVWFFKDDNCEANWEAGYTVALILVIFFFISLIPYVCICCVLGTAAAAMVKKD